MSTKGDPLALSMVLSGEGGTPSLVSAQWGTPKTGQGVTPPLPQTKQDEGAMLRVVTSCGQAQEDFLLIIFICSINKTFCDLCLD